MVELSIFGKYIYVLVIKMKKIERSVLVFSINLLVHKQRYKQFIKIPNGKKRRKKQSVGVYF